MHVPIVYLAEVQLGHTEHRVVRFPILSNSPGYRITSSQSSPAAVPSRQLLPLLFQLPLPSLLFPSFHPSAVQSGNPWGSHFSARLSYIRSMFPHSKGRSMCVESRDFCQNNDSLCTMQSSSRGGHPLVKSRVPVPRNARGLPQSPPKGRVWLPRHSGKSNPS